MLVNHKVLYQGAPAANAQTLLFTASSQVILSDITIVNTGASAQTVNMSIGGSGVTNRFLNTKNVASGTDGEWNGAKTMESGKTIWAGIGTGSNILTITIHGQESP